ncbi:MULTISPECIES: DUF4365 domain-containing protein [unclassified Mesorhizobium]|uniref:DUF4365 domain-containing protein n=1 Tax=unclassified Mesorhizobium TaxID=325217 RepID=UPI000BAFB304|nr:MULTISPECIES: DUF4365 domain-containing protein [unclassified Mesorhizobium]PBC21279.1 hypothetical protein CK226_20820 [Mesorhizobium sp. WSM4311]TRD04793.1 DUF4365 domain-containing protein [Mesorhizobium sp. WSM4305]
MASVVGSALKEREGVIAADTIFTKQFRWLFREQKVLDFGVDAEVEITEDDMPTGKLIALQIKSGTSFFKREIKEGYVFYGEMRHLKYWTNHVLPMFLILHNPETGVTLYQRIEERLCKVTDKGWSIVVPRDNALNASAAGDLAAGPDLDEEGQLRLRFSLDAPLMERFVGADAKMIWEYWFNKSLSLRNARFIFEDEEPIKVGGWYPTDDIGLAMQNLFPWLTYQYEDDSTKWDVSGEADIFTLLVSLRPEAKAYLEAERFFREGITDETPDQPVRDDEEDDGWIYRIRDDD